MKATFDDFGNFRLKLHEKISEHGNKALIGFLCNPSKAGQCDIQGREKTDNTFEKFKAIGAHHKCSDVYLFNVIPLISTESELVDERLKNYTQAYVERMIEIQDLYIDYVLKNTAATILYCGWGSYDKIKSLKFHADQFLKKYGELNLMCQVINKDGSPRHPLYISAKAPLIGFNA